MKSLNLKVLLSLLLASISGLQAYGQSALLKVDSIGSCIEALSVSDMNRQISIKKVADILNDSRVRASIGSTSDGIDESYLKTAINSAGIFELVEAQLSTLSEISLKISRGESLDRKSVLRLRAIDAFFQLLQRSGDVEFVKQVAEANGQDTINMTLLMPPNALFEDETALKDFYSILAGDTSIEKLTDFSMTVSFALQEHNKLLQKDEEVYEHLNLKKAYYIAKNIVFRMINQ